MKALRAHSTPRIYERKTDEQHKSRLIKKTAALLRSVSTGMAS